MKRVRLSLVIVFLAIVLASCAGRTFVQNTYTTIYTSGTAYDAGMKIVSDLQKQGTITQAQREIINQYANVFYATYHDTVDKFAIYLATANPTDQDKVNLGLNAMMSAWVNLAAAVNKIKAGTLSATLPK